jgi:protein kinase C substrate 80K-H
MYTLGTKCWNGPQRSVKVSLLLPIFTQVDPVFLKLELTCGTENVLLTIQELEKCEYQFTGTTPALCLPLYVQEQIERDEL